MPVPGRFSDDAEAQADARVGTVLNDKWTLERLLGAGGMGAVYAGRHRNGARAAVKVLHRYLSQHEEVRARFLREGYAANRVDRPGVVKVLDDDIVKGGPDDGTAYLVMELLEGQSLEARVERGSQVTESQFLAIADAVLDVLDAAHTSGVVHRDIKPDNLFIARDETGAERIKVLDFGLARMLEGRSVTTYGIAIGTPSYMSPEQAAGRNDEIDGRTDLFALAASGFRLVTGRKLHEGSSPIDVMSKMATLPAPKIRTVAPQVSEVFARVIDRGLQFIRDHRYATAAAMRADVQSALAALALGVQPTTALPVTSKEKVIELSTRDFVDPSSQVGTVSDSANLVVPAAAMRSDVASAPQPESAPHKPHSVVQPDTVREPEPAVVSASAISLLQVPTSGGTAPMTIPLSALPPPKAEAAAPLPVPAAAPAVAVAPVSPYVASLAPSPPVASLAPPTPAPAYGVIASAAAMAPTSPDLGRALPSVVHPEDSLSGIPMQRVSMVPAVVIGAVLVTGAAMAYGLSRSSSSAPMAPLSMAPAMTIHDAEPARDAEAELHDAMTDAGGPVEASAVATLTKEASAPKPRPIARPSTVHNRPVKRPKH